MRTVRYLGSIIRRTLSGDQFSGLGCFVFVLHEWMLAKAAREAAYVTPLRAAASHWGLLTLPQSKAKTNGLSVIVSRHTTTKAGWHGRGVPVTPVVQGHVDKGRLRTVPFPFTFVLALESRLSSTLTFICSLPLLLMCPLTSLAIPPSLPSSPVAPLFVMQRVASLLEGLVQAPGVCGGGVGR